MYWNDFSRSRLRSRDCQRGSREQIISLVASKCVFSRPKPLDLTAPQESILLEHLAVFQKNGFEFVVNENMPPGRRVFLTTIPHSKNTVFGVEGTYDAITTILACDQLTNAVRYSVLFVFYIAPCSNDRIGILFITWYMPLLWHCLFTSLCCTRVLTRCGGANIHPQRAPRP